MRSLSILLIVALCACTVVTQQQNGKAKREKKKGRSIESESQQSEGRDRYRTAATPVPYDIEDPFRHIMATARCVSIPSNFTLCNNMAYSFMRLPTVLQHDNVDDAMKMSRDFTPMLRFKCHSKIRLFLCSMFASICLPELPILELKPCRSLCEEVKVGCEPNISAYGYSWPAIFNCSNFPEDMPCVDDNAKDPELPDEDDNECNACTEQYDVATVMRHACNADVVFISKGLSFGSNATRLTLNATKHRKNTIRAVRQELDVIEKSTSMEIFEPQCTCNQVAKDKNPDAMHLVMYKLKQRNSDRRSEPNRMVTYVLNISTPELEKMVKVVQTFFKKSSQPCPVSQQDLMKIAKRLKSNKKGNKNGKGANGNANTNSNANGAKRNANANGNGNGNKGNANRVMPGPARPGNGANGPRKAGDTQAKIKTTTIARTRTTVVTTTVAPTTAKLRRNIRTTTTRRPGRRGKRD